MTYEYKWLRKPTEDDLNRWGAEGFRFVGMAVDGRDGEVKDVLMERATEDAPQHPDQAERPAPPHIRRRGK